MLKIDDVFEVEEGTFLVVADVEYLGYHYCLCNKVNNEQFTNEFSVYLNEEDGVSKVIDEEFLNEISPLLTAEANKNMKNAVDAANNGQLNGGN